MSDIGYLMQLQQQINNQGRKDLQGIGENIGNIFAQRGQRSFEQAATQFFMNENNQTPEKIQEFSSMYPQVPKQAVWSIAGQVATQQKAQRLKDAWPTLQSKIKLETAKDPSWIPDMKTLAEIGINPIDMPDVVAALTKFKELRPDIKFEKTSPGETATQTIGGRPTDVTIKGQPIPEKKDVDIINPDGTRSEKVTETEAKNREASGWTRGTRLFTPASEKPLRSLKTIYGPNGQTREIQVGDNFTPPSGWSLKAPDKPNVEKPEYKPGQALKRISQIDSAISKIESGGMVDNIIAIQNPELAALMGKNDPESKQLAINSLKTEREYMSEFAPKGSIKPLKTGTKEKSLDETTATAILKEAGGNKEKARLIAKKRGYVF